MSLSRPTTVGWYLVRIPRASGSSMLHVAFCFPGETEMMGDFLERLIPLSHAALSSAEFVGPFDDPAAARRAASDSPVGRTRST